MNPGICGPNGHPVITDEMRAQAQIQQMYFSVYFSLIPVVAADELRKHEDWNGDGIDTERITSTAKTIAVAAMKKIGVDIQ